MSDKLQFVVSLSADSKLFNRVPFQRQRQTEVYRTLRQTPRRTIRASDRLLHKFCVRLTLMTQSSLVNNLRVASLCPASWDSMSGDNTVRYCELCHLNVYNFSAMTTAEVEKLLMTNEGRRICGRLYKRADGTVITRDCPVGLRALRKRIARRAGAVLTALLS